MTDPARTAAIGTGESGASHRRSIVLSRSVLLPLPGPPRTTWRLSLPIMPVAGPSDLWASRGPAAASATGSARTPFSSGTS